MTQQLAAEPRGPKIRPLGEERLAAAAKPP
jgi:hypothetical protein